MLSIESRPDSYGTSKSEQKKEEDEMNKVILIGRLTKAPEIKYLQDDNKTAMARYTVIRQIKRCRFHQIKTGLSEHLTMG